MFCMAASYPTRMRFPSVPPSGGLGVPAQLEAPERLQPWPGSRVQRCWIAKNVGGTQSLSPRDHTIQFLLTGEAVGAQENGRTVIFDPSPWDGLYTY